MLTKLSEDKRIEGTQSFIYGANGVGKTGWSAACSDRTIVVTDRNGKATLKSKWWKEKYKCDPFIVEISPDDTPSAPKFYDKLRNLVDGFLAKDTRDTWDNLVLDDLNSIRMAARNKAIELNGLTGRSKTSGNMQSGKFKDIILPTIADFGTEMGLVESFLRQLTDGLREENKNSFVHAHERFYRSKDGVILSTKPLLTGVDSPDSIPGIFDLVWYMRVVGTGSNTKREFVTDTESGIMAKTRWGGLFKNPERDISSAEVIRRITKWQVEGTV